MPPSPMRLRMWYRSASTLPISESEPLGRSAVPSAGQNRAAVSYSVPQWGHTLSTATAGCVSLVVCCANPPEPSWLVASGCSSESDATTGASPEGTGGDDDLGSSGVSVD